MPKGRRFRWLRRFWNRHCAKIANDKRTVLITGVALVFVPTAFTVIPEWGRSRLGLRVVLLGGWVLVAAAAVLGSMRHSAHVEAVVDPPMQRQNDQRAAAGALMLDRLLTPAGSPLTVYEFRVFIYDHDRKRLMPSFEPQGLEALRAGRSVRARSAEPTRRASTSA